MIFFIYFFKELSNFGTKLLIYTLYVRRDAVIYDSAVGLWVCSCCTSAWDSSRAAVQQIYSLTSQAHIIHTHCSRHTLDVLLTHYGFVDVSRWTDIGLLYTLYHLGDNNRSRNYKKVNSVVTESSNSQERQKYIENRVALPTSRSSGKWFYNFGPQKWFYNY